MTIREFKEVYDGYFEGEKINHNGYNYDYDYESIIENHLDSKIIRIYHREYDPRLVVVFEDEKEDLK